MSNAPRALSRSFLSQVLGALLVVMPLATVAHAHQGHDHSQSQKKKEHPEHPEHPAEHPAEHPEHPTKKAGPNFSVQDISSAIKKYVKNEMALKGGYLLVYDAKAKKPLVLTLTKVHEERLSQVGPDIAFVCADFKDKKSGTIYDLDFFLKGPDAKHLVVTEISVHKENGKARYGWYEDHGTWKKTY